MKCANTFLLLMLSVAASVASGQNTGARATPQTQGSAPAATGSAATGAQAAGAAAAQDSASRGSGAAANRGTRSRSGTANAGSGTAGRAGITGVPGYRAGFRGERGTPAAVANGRVEVTGDADGNGVPDRAAKNDGSALPGVVGFRNAFGIAAGTPIRVRLAQEVDSGHARNGDVIQGVLADALGRVPAGAPVQLTVVAAAKAGEMSSGGELSLQVIRVNGQELLSDVITALGKEGEKLTPDAAPARGTEAAFAPDKPLTLPAS